MSYYIPGTDYVKEWFGNRLKKNFINKRATCFSGILCIGGFTLYAYSKRNPLPTECSSTGMAVGLTALLWSTLIAKVKWSYIPLSEVQSENDILLDIFEEVLVTTDSETEMDGLMDILRSSDEILANVSHDVQVQKKDLENVVELMGTGECPAFAEPTTTLYFRMFTEISQVFCKYELDVQPSESMVIMPIMDLENRPPHSKKLLKKIVDVFLKYMYATECATFGFKTKMAQELIREKITRARKHQALKTMMQYKVSKRIPEGTVELVQFLKDNIAERMSADQEA